MIASVSWSAAHVAVLAALGLLAGAINAAAGGGSLLTFPALVALGLPALTANLSNTVAQCPGYLAIVHGYRPELAGQRERVVRLLPAAILGGSAGVALLELGSRATFRAVVPALVLLASILLALQDRVRRRLTRPDAGGHPHAGLIAGVALACAYSTYFGAAAGVLMLAALGTFLADDLQRVNALSRLFIALVSVMAGVAFIVLGPISWVPVVVLAPTTMVGGRVGVALVRRLSPGRLRAGVVLIGLGASAYLIATSW